MPDTTFVSAENAWVHDALNVIEDVFGISQVNLSTADGHLNINVTCDGIEE